MKIKITFCLFVIYSGKIKLVILMNNFNLSDDKIKFIFQYFEHYSYDPKINCIIKFVWVIVPSVCESDSNLPGFDENTQS